MNKLIDIESASEIVRFECGSWKGLAREIIKQFKALPSANQDTDEWCMDCKEYDSESKCCPRFNRVIRNTVQRQGKWIGTESDGFADGQPVYYEWTCSVCGCVFEDEEPHWNFCPNCGARMVNDADSN